MAETLQASRDLKNEDVDSPAADCQTYLFLFKFVVCKTII
jgi:hypothetical protein